MAAFETCLFGAFQSGVNAGGQVSNKQSFHTNPQYLINIPKDKGKYKCCYLINYIGLSNKSEKNVDLV